jgi:hypothetical protein
MVILLAEWIKFPSVVKHEDVEIDQLQISIVDMVKTLEYGEFNNVFEIRHFLNPGPICPRNFNLDDLHRNLILFLLESEHRMKPYDITTHYLYKQFDKPSGHFATLPENDECVFI